MIVEIKSLFLSMAIAWPSTRFGNFLRKKIYSRKLKKLGDNPLFLSGVKVSSPELIEVGNSVILGTNVHISAGNCHGIFIGDNVSIADGAYMRSANHVFDDLKTPINAQGHTARRITFQNRDYSIVIEDNVWIGARAIILSGAHLGAGSVISAGAVVSSMIPPYSIVVGNPGRVVGNREKKVHKSEASEENNN